MGFNYTLILPLIERLKLEWTNDHANTERNKTLWAHEWRTYGTCTMDLDALDNSFKFLQKGNQARHGLTK